MHEIAQIHFGFEWDIFEWALKRVRRWGILGKNEQSGAVTCAVRREEFRATGCWIQEAPSDDGTTTLAAEICSRESAVFVTRYGACGCLLWSLHSAIGIMP